MEPTWTERADKILELMKKVTKGKTCPEGSPEKEFYREVWSLCQRLKDQGADGGQTSPVRSLID